MKYIPKEITEEVNVSQVHPLVNFGKVLGTVIGVSFVIYLGLGWAVDWIVPHVSPETEKAIGDNLAATVPFQMAGEVVTDDPRQAYLENLIADLSENSDRIQDLPVTLHIVETPITNAAALAGGHLFVTTAFLDEVESENELAFVLAHELGHLNAKDSLKALGRSLVIILGSSILFGTSGIQDSTGVISNTLNLSALHYSRTQEYNADHYALTAIVRRYGHGDHTLDFFKRIEVKEGQNALTVSEYFQTHPLTQKRIETLNEIATEEGWKMQGSPTPLGF